MIARGVGAGLLVLVAGCTPSAARDAGAEKAAVNAAMEGYAGAIRGGDSLAVRKYWTDDAVFMSPGMATSRGMAPLDSMHRASVRNARMTEVTVHVEETLVDHDLAVQTATYTEATQPAKGKPIVAHGRLVFVWLRQPDGNWKIARGISTDLPAK